MCSIDTVGDLIAVLQDYELGTPVRLVTQFHRPFAYAVGGVALTTHPVVWIAVGRQVMFLPALVREALGWSP